MKKLNIQYEVDEIPHDLDDKWIKERNNIVEFFEKD